MLIWLACCKKNLEISAYEPAFTNTIEENGICRIDGEFRHLECMRKKHVSTN
jgi:hypothetical protein